MFFSFTYRVDQIYVALVLWYVEKRQCKVMVAIVQLPYSQESLAKMPNMIDVNFELVY